MKKTSLPLSLLTILGTFIFAATPLFAMNAGMSKTPILTFSGVDSGRLAQVVGYPNGKPTLLFYTNHLSGSQLISIDADSLVPHNININLSFPEIEKELKLKNNIDLNIAGIDQIIWFNNSYFALVIGENNKTHTSLTAILESADGKEWNVIKQWPSLKTDEPGGTSDATFSLAGSGPASNPTLVVIYAGELYYKPLKDNVDWQNSHVEVANDANAKAHHPFFSNTYAYPYSYQVLSYKEGFLADSSEDDKTQNKMTEKLLFSKDGKTWVKLSQPQGKFAFMFFTAGDKLFAYLADNPVQNATSDEDSASVDSIRTNSIAEMDIDFTNNSLIVNTAVPFNSLQCKACTYQNQASVVTDVIYSPASASYYWVFNGSHDSAKFPQLAWAKVDSLQSLIQKPELFPVNSENERIHFDTDSGLYKSLIIFNDKPYLLAGVPGEKKGETSTVLFQINE